MVPRPRPDTIVVVPTLSFAEARATVQREVQTAALHPHVETVGLASAVGRVLAQPAAADRNYPPFDRSVRDGFAVRSTDIPGTLHVIGEVRAGEVFHGHVGVGQAVEIMTGAPVPSGADCVVMVEHCTRPTTTTVATEKHLAPGTHIARLGCEARSGETVLAAGTRIDFAHISWLATTGHAEVFVYRRPRVAIIATGDEIVDVHQVPANHQIRNSNAWSIAAQVARAGGDPVVLPIARDTLEATQVLIEEGLQADLLLLSGGVSAGKYDVVEQALAAAGAGFYFDRVAIQPGQPLVFGRARGTFFFGLPGNPVSTMVTFEVFARAALELLAGCGVATLPLALARLTKPFHHKAGLTRFLPAEVRDGTATPVDWQGSGDVAALCRANAFLVADADRAEYQEGDTIPILFR